MPPLIVTAAIIQRHQQVLITRRLPGTRHAGLWEFPGGKLDDGESPQQGLARELREELDLPIAVGDLFDAVYYEYPWGPVLILAYRAEPLTTTIRNLAVAEHRWVSPAQLDRYPLLPADAPLVARLKQQFTDRT